MQTVPKTIARRSVIFCGLILSSLLSACVKSPEDPLKVGSNNWAGYAPLHLADVRGFYAKPIRLIEFSSNSDVMRAFRNGVIDVATLTLDEALLVKQYDPTARIFLVADVSNGADMILSHAKYKSLADLKGRRVGVEQTALGAFLLSRALQRAGMSSKDIRIVPVDASEHEQAFRKGEIEGLVTFAPMGTRLEASGAVRLFDSSQIPSEIMDVLIARDATITAKEPYLRALVDGWYEAIHQLETAPEKALAEMAPRLAVDSRHLGQIYTQIRFVDRRESERLLQHGDSSIAETAGLLARIMLDNGLLYRQAETQTLMPQPLQLQTLYR